MTARHEWREAHRAARKADPATRWVRLCFPKEWSTDATARRLGIVRPALKSTPCRVAIALSVAADKRRNGETEGARLFIGFARKANADRLTPSPAFGA